MITATLSSLPDGRPYLALGVVGGIAHVPPGPPTLEAVRQQLEQQAAALRADAVIDVRLQVVSLPTSPARPGPGALAIALIGTAVRYA